MNLTFAGGPVFVVFGNYRPIGLRYLVDMAQLYEVVFFGEVFCFVDRVPKQLLTVPYTSIEADKNVICSLNDRECHSIDFFPLQIRHVLLFCVELSVFRTDVGIEWAFDPADNLVTVEGKEAKDADDSDVKNVDASFHFMPNNSIL